MDASQRTPTTKPVSDETMMRARLATLVRRQPLGAIAAAGAVGVLLGGVFFSRLGRLVFLAAAGYLANDLWHREGRLDAGGGAQRPSTR